MARLSILIAPDSFKECLTARAVAEAIAEGIRRAWPEALPRALPLSDGGEGLLDCLAGTLEVEERASEVTGPDGSPRSVRWLFEPAAHRAWIEVAEVIPLSAVGSRRVGAATSRGVGELIRIAANHGAKRVALGIGGTGTVDGGAGCLIGLGAAVCEAGGVALDPGSARLGEVRSVRLERGGLPEVELLCDVRSPMVGPRGAAHLYGPQKGLGVEGAAQVDQRLRAWGRVLDDGFGCDPSELPFAGAGGGLAGALMAACGAVPRSGIERLAEHLQLDEAIQRATIVVTGEGRTDEQSREGKVIDHVLSRAKELARPVQVISGRIEPDAVRWLASRGARAHACSPAHLSESEAIARAEELLISAAYELFAPER